MTISLQHNGAGGVQPILRMELLFDRVLPVEQQV